MILPRGGRSILCVEREHILRQQTIWCGRRWYRILYVTASGTRIRGGVFGGHGPASDTYRGVLTNAVGKLSFNDDD